MIGGGGTKIQNVLGSRIGHFLAIWIRMSSGSISIVWINYWFVKWKMGSEQGILMSMQGGG